MSYYSKKSFERNSEKKSFFNSAKSIITFLAIIFIGCICSYLWEINYISEQGYKVKELEKQIAVIKEENEKLGIQLVQAQSMGNLQEKVAALSMVTVSEIVYIDDSSYLARK